MGEATAGELIAYYKFMGTNEKWFLKRGSKRYRVDFGSSYPLLSSYLSYMVNHADKSHCNAIAPTANLIEDLMNKRKHRTTNPLDHQ